MEVTASQSAPAKPLLSATEPAGCSWHLRADAMAWLFMLIGAAIRLREYFFARSLWVDEASPAISVVSRSFAELTEPMENSQVAPTGFLIITRAAVEMLGPTEKALRLFPLLCGLGVMWLIYRIARRVLPPVEGVIAVAAAALMEAENVGLVYYSNEFKPYIVDAFAAAAVTLCAIKLLQQGVNRARLIAFGVVSTICVWLAFPAVIVIAGTGLALMGREWFGGRRKGAITVAVACAVAAASFGAHYFLFQAKVQSNPRLKDMWWNHLFAPFPPKSIADLKWYPGSFLEFFRNPFGAELAGVAAALFIFGLVWLYRRRRWELGLFVFPLAINFVMSWLRQYPAGYSRVVLYGVPVAMIVVAAGLRLLREREGAAGKVTFATMAVLLFIHAIPDAMNRAKAPLERDEIRPVLAQLSEKIQPQDTLFLFYGCDIHYEYYVRRAKQFPKLEPFTPIAGHREGARKPETDWPQYRKELDSLRGKKRVWIVMTQWWQWAGADEQKLWEFMMNERGTKLDEIRAAGAAAYLYDFSSPPAKP